MNGDSLAVQDALALGLLRSDPHRLTLSQRLLLEKYEWLSAEEGQLLLQLHCVGEDGLVSRLAKKLGRRCPEGWLRLDACGLVEWQRDQRGREAYLVLSVKGDELATAMVTANHPYNTNTGATK